MLRSCFTFAFVILSALCIAADPGEIQMPERGICAHRGNNAHFPENTVPAFQSAVEVGAAQVELDVCYSKDKKMVIMHDSDVKRTTDGSGDIRQKTLDEIKALKIVFKGEVQEGVQVPTLQEVLAVIPKNVWINIHLKENRLDLILEIAETLTENGQMHQAFLLCSPDLMKEARKTYPELKLCLGPAGKTFQECADQAIANDAQFVQPNPWAHKTLEPEAIQQLHDAGVKINYFGVKGPEHAKELMEMGVDFPLCDDATACVKEIQK
ncbi:MAG: hypothetical protein IJK97_04985 [Thermoguttaceae bacterium]|nr:hypothetical protein [Thermoguttaceae bacterium]MBR0191637.1 hypothetical protein [Thermoguttaceae bacterium]